MFTPRTRTTIPILVLLALTSLEGCAHRRESYEMPSRGVHVRAPFVDIQVPTGPRRVRVERPATLSEPALEVLPSYESDWDRD